MNFHFKLQGKEFFPLYIAAFLLYVLPMIGIQVLGRLMKTDPNNMANVLIMFVLLATAIVSMLIFTTPILKKLINNTAIADNSFTYTASIGRYVWLNVWNGFLSIITLGVYLPWCVKRIAGYVVQHVSYKDKAFAFMGKGWKLLVVLVCTILIPMVIWMGMLLMAKGVQPKPHFTIIFTVLLYVLLVPYMYYVYKWMADLSYKHFVIRWNTAALRSIGTILRELVLTVITVGIYGPIALAKLFKYFIKRTVILQNDVPTYRLDSELSNSEAFKVTWKAGLLTIATLGIYGAWAYCNVMKLYVNSMSVKDVD